MSISMRKLVLALMASTAMTGVAVAQTATTATPAVNCATAPAGTPGCPVAPASTSASAPAKPASKPVAAAKPAPAAVDIGTVVVAQPQTPVVLTQPGLTASPTDLAAARQAQRVQTTTATTASTAAASPSAPATGIPGRPVTPGGVTGAQLGGGYIIPETATKTRSTVTRDAIDKQSPTANPYQMINLLPGVVQASPDNTGLNGGNIHLRGFNSDHIGFTIEGAPVNDSGNYALFPQEYVDGENISQVSIAQGSPDLDSPHIGAIGGVINTYMRDPTDKAGAYVDFTIGSYGLAREFVRGDTGQVGAFRSYISVSNLRDDHWSGVGSDSRQHVDFKTVGTISAGNTVSLSAIYNVGDNNFYVQPTLAQFNTDGFVPAYNPTLSASFFNKVSPINQSTVAGQTGLAGSNTNYYQYRVNPFRNLILSAPSTFTINDKLKFDTIPYFWYGFGNGGGVSSLDETKGFFWGNVKVTGVDLNSNGNTKDTGILFYNPSITETYRPGVINKFTYNMANHQIVFGNWFEDAYHHQFGPYEALNPDGSINDLYAGGNNLTLPSTATCAYKNPANGVLTPLASCPTGQVQKREQLTKTITNMLFVGDTWKVTKDLTLDYGVKQAFINRTVEDGMQLTAYPSTSIFDTATLPTAGFSYQLNRDSKVFGSVATSFRSGPNFQLVPTYSNSAGQIAPPDVIEPERGTTYEIGHRFQNKMLATSISGFYGQYNNYQLSTTIADPAGSASTVSETINAGRVQNYGVDAEIGTAPVNNFRFYASGELLHAELMDNLPVSLLNAAKTKVINDALPTAGKILPGAPAYQLGIGIDYDNGHLFGNLDYKYTGAQYSTLMNDEQMKAFGRVDMTLGYRFSDYGYFKAPTVKLNIFNVLNTRQLVGINGAGGSNALATIGVNGNTLAGSAPTYFQGEGASGEITLSSGF